MASYEYITIRYSNSCDIDNIIFQNGFAYELNLIGVLGEPKYEHIEKVNENERKEIGFTSRTLKKSISLIVTGNEQLADVLNFIRICDTKILSNKVGEVYSINEMQVDSDLQNGIGIIKVQFVLFIVTNTVCCNNNILNGSLENPINAGYVTYLSDNYKNPQAIPVGEIFIFLSSTGKYYLIIRTNEINNSGLLTGWNYYSITLTDYVYSSHHLAYAFRNIDSSNESEVLLPLPFLSDLTIITYPNYKLSGQCLQGYIIGFQTKAPGGTYSNSNINGTAVNYTTALNFNGSGVVVKLTEAGTYVRAYLATVSAPTTPLCYSNEATYIP